MDAHNVKTEPKKKAGQQKSILRKKGTGGFINELIIYTE